MKHRIARVFCALFAGVLLAGCSAQGGTSGVSIADFGSSGGVNYSGTTSAAPEPDISGVTSSVTLQTSDSTSSAPGEATAETGQHPDEPVQTSAAEMTTSPQTTGETAKPSTTAGTTSSATTKAPATTSDTATATATTVTTTTNAAAAPEVTEPDFGSNSYKAVNYSEIKGIWISYIELAEIMQGQSESGFRSSIGAVFDNCTGLGINTVYVHVRSHSDAYYRSELFPWSRYITGTLGKDPGYDPLEVMLEEAHRRNLSFQAWINPLRACGTGQINSYGSSYPVYSFATADGMKGKYAVDVNGTYYLNPAYSAVTDLIASGASEILANYDVDGLHIDDYFYPTTDAYFDSSAYSGSGYSTLSDFRFANCDRMVRGLYNAVKGANPTAVFSVSVQGRIDNNYNQLYADVRKWCTTPGYLDVMIPQIYYGFENSAAPYKSTLDEWEALAVKGGIPLVAGLSVSKVGCEDTWAGSGKYEWINNSNILSRQLAEAKKCRSYGGFALYSYRSVFSPESSVSAAVKKEISALKDTI